MAKYDAFRLKSGSLAVDVQADLLRDLATRLMIPLLPRDSLRQAATRLNPILVIEGREHVLATHLAASVPVREIGARVTSLIEHDTAIGNAIDMLLSGF